MIRNYNKDIMHWDKFPDYDMIWCDPPWEQKMVKYFQTIMLRDTGEVADNTIGDILTTLARLSDKSKPLVIEYSIHSAYELVQIMAEHGHTLMSTNERIYDKKPFLILVFNVPLKINESVNPSTVITESLRNTPYQVIFDPFAGIGFTAKAVRKAGKIYIGSEINKARFERLKKINQ